MNERSLAMTDRQRGILEMTAAMLISGSIGWFVLASGRPVVEVVFWRCAIGAGSLALLCLALGLFRQRLTRAQVALAILGGVAIVLNWLLLFGSYAHASIAVATAVYNVQPFILLGLGAMLFGERITIVKVFWLTLAFAGVLAIVLTKPSAAYLAGGNYVLGIAMALLASLGWAVAAITTKRLMGVPPQLIALIHVMSGMLMFAPMVSWANPPSDAATWTMLATLGIVHTGIMYALMYAAVQRLPTDLQGALSFIYPVIAIMVDVFALGTTLQPIQIAGIAAIILAAAGATLGWGARVAVAKTV
jgi:drug/metabolite transporter (DMT)-like permease